MKAIIALQGRHDSGKTTTLKKLHDALIKLGYTLIWSTKKPRGDFMAIFEKNGIFIGITSAGDDYEKVKNKLEELIKQKCSVCICACRSYGYTVEVLEEFEQQGFSVHFQQKTVSETVTKQKSANSEDVQGLVECLVRVLKDKKQTS